MTIVCFQWMCEYFVELCTRGGFLDKCFTYWFLIKVGLTLAVHYQTGVFIYDQMTLLGVCFTQMASLMWLKSKNYPHF
jgi:hypothetical protein